jgi:tetratricopeptide (TPR) repeat protein
MVEIKQIIQEFIKLKQKAGRFAETSPELAKYITEIDNYYWEKTTNLIADYAKDFPDSLVFTKYDRILIDAGVLDFSLVSSDDKFRIDLIKELYQDAPKNYFYFTQWLSTRYRDYISYEKLREHESEHIVDKVISEAYNLRLKIYQKLKPFLVNIPGFPQQAIELFLGGRIDAMIDSLTLQIKASEKPEENLISQRTTLVDIKKGILTRAKENAIIRDDYRLFEQLNEVEYVISTRLKSASVSLKEKKEITISPTERINFIKGELRLVRSLLKLGITGSGLTRTHSVLISDKQRITKTILAEIHQTIKTLDPTLSATANVLIAPYVGNGFYEWDRDTIFVPLIPTRSQEEAIATAFANYRIMLDTLKNRGMLKKAYEQRFPGKNFRANFIEDYKAWVLGVGKGIRGAIDKVGFEFFKDYIGPSHANLFAPAELSRLSDKERDEIIKSVRSLINEGAATYQDYYKIAVAYWQIPNAPEALNHLAHAVKLNPTDGRILLALGYLCLKMGIEDKAKEAFEECVDIASNTVWQVYAQNYLQKL